MKNEKVLELLKDGPMTSAEISEALGICAHHASSMMLRLIKENRKHPQLVHIKSWVTDHKNQRRYPRALYELGAGPNARKREYEARKRSILKTSSVFNLAVPLKCLRSRSTPGTKTANSASNAST